MTMADESVAVLTSVLFLLSIFHQDAPSGPGMSNRQKAGYFGPVHQVRTETKTLSRKLYHESSNGQRALVEDTTAQFGNGGFLTKEEEFDENGRLVSDASSDREAEDGQFRSAYKYDENRRLSEEDHFNRDGSSAGKTQYFYDSGGKKTEELFYTATGVLSSKARYDEHQNTTDVEWFGPDGSIVRKQSIVHSYRREGNTLEDSDTPLQPKSGLPMRVVSPQNDEFPQMATESPQQFKIVHTYNDSGQLVKEFDGAMEKNYDSKGRLSVEVFGNTRTTYSYDDQGNIAEMLVVEPPGPYSLSGGNGRYVYKYDSYGNEKERIVYKRDGSVSMHYLYTYEYDSHNNWTKRVQNEKVFNFREDIKPSTLEILTAEYRTISYH
jgi:hypothetical protein